MGAIPTKPANPLAGLYDFVRGHMAVMNTVIFSSCTLVGVLDFLAPRLSVLPRIVYSATAALVGVMLISAIAPALAGRAFEKVGVVARREGSTPLWGRPLWQLSTLVLSIVTLAGWASIAKAADGGFVASNVPAVRAWQESLLSLHGEVADISVGVRSANSKLDQVVAAVDPANVADRCADLQCAVDGGASATAIRRLFERGAKLAGNPINDGALLMSALISSAPDRLLTIDLLAQHGLDLSMLFLPRINDRAALTKAGAINARDIVDAAPSSVNPAFGASGMPSGDKQLDAWNEMAGCLLRTAGGASAMEVASLLSDAELYAHIKSKGQAMPARPLACAPLGRRGAPAARVDIEPATGKFLGVKAG